MTAAPVPEDDSICDDCGRYGAIDFGGRQLCPDCYECSGSCCPEFGKAVPEQGVNPVKPGRDVPDPPAQRCNF